MLVTITFRDVGKETLHVAVFVSEMADAQYAESASASCRLSTRLDDVQEGILAKYLRSEGPMYERYGRLGRSDDSEEGG